MIIQRINPKGLDLKIYSFQQELDKVLCHQLIPRLNWQGDIAIYGKVQKTARASDQLTIPEAYMANGEYTQPFVDDTKAASLGFYVSNQSVQTHAPIADIDLICTVDLNKIYLNSNREDWKAVMQVYNIIQASVIELGQIREGLNDVFRGFTGMKNYQPSEISNWFIFSINFKTTFDNVI
jgi:hypothetical protein